MLSRFLLKLCLLIAPAGVQGQVWDTADTGQSGQMTILGGIAGGSLLGLPLATGDFDGDGNGDIVAAPMNADAPAHDVRTHAGLAVMLYGNGTIAGEIDIAALLNHQPARPAKLIFGADPGDYFGTEVVAADLYLDGFDDAIIGTQQGDGPGNGRINAGEVVIIWGGPRGNGSVADLALMEGSEGLTFIYGGQSGDCLGVWVSAGDFDGDGITDALLGADQANGPNETRPHAGETYVLYGGSALRQRRSLDLASADESYTVIYGIDAEDHSGSTIVASMSIAMGLGIYS